MAEFLIGQLTGRPFDDGVNAFERGLARTRAPYAPGTWDHLEWVRGWNLAQQREDEEADEMAESLASIRPETRRQISP